MKIPAYACAMIFLCSASSWGLQEANCVQISALARMARARSVNALSQERKQAGDSYRVQLVFAYRSFQVASNVKNAERLLALLPQDDFQQTVVMTLGDSLCSAEPSADTLALSRVYEGFARELARAVLSSPRYLPAYVAYAMVAVRDPHSDFAPRMVRVCQKRHAQFASAIKRLPQKDQQEFAKHVMDPNTCRAIAIPEAD